MRGIRRAVGVAVVVAALGMSPAHAAVTPRIIGGNTVNAATVPWTVALLATSVSDGYNAQFCGGTLIDPSWVLTAAHCTAGAAASDINVAWGISDLHAITAADRHALSQIIVHPQYNANESTSDVALLRLTTPVPGATTLALNASASFPALNASLDTYGWGTTMYPSSSYPNLLMGVTLTDRAGPSSAATCGLYGGDYIGDHIVCAGVAGGGKDACYGDSGGPLVATNASAQKVLVGVTSWGEGCTLASYPGVWSRVSSYADWVDQQIHTPATPRVSIGDATLTEGDSGNRLAYFTVTVSPAPLNTLTVPFSTAPVNATEKVDFVAKLSKTLTFKPGQAAKVVSVAVRSDDTIETTETFRVNLGTPGGLDGATLVNLWGTGTILDDDATPVVKLTIGDTSTREGDNGTGTLAVKAQVALSAAAGTPFTIPYTTVAGTAGTRDYTTKSATLRFTGLAKTKVVSIPLKREWIPEGNETFTVTLGAPSIPGVSVTRGTGTFTIVNDD